LSSPGKACDRIGTGLINRQVERTIDRRLWRERRFEGGDDASRL
jgi:hypothetical protein